MGLDTVEFIMTVEERFGVEIDDREASEIRTVGELADLVCSKEFPPGGCRTQQSFYFVRKQLVNVLGISGRAVRPETTLAGITPVHRRRQDWEVILQRLAIRRTPSLVLPRRLSVAIDTGSVAFLVLSTLLLGIVLRPWSVAALAGFLSTVLFWLFIRQICESRETVFPSYLATVGDLAKYVAGRAPTFLKFDDQLPERERVVLDIGRILREDFGVTQKITERSRIVADLGLDS